jgi:UDP-GlcNAc:undecaprenyl-phosphate GlcNAc-1-phosphate transferase
VRYYLLICAIACVITFASTFVLRKFAGKISRNELRARDVHSQPIPRIGGLAMLAGLLISLGVASLLPFFTTEFTDNFEIPAIMIGGTIIAVVGVLDDLFNLDWMIKLAGQIIAATFVAYNGVQILSLPIGGLTVGSNRTSLVFTVLIIVTVINAINFIDGLDGLAAGVTVIGALAFFIYSWNLLSWQYNYASAACLVTAVLIGICIGFLPHNFNPAKIFMGDTGSGLIGFIMACSVLVVTGKIDESSANIHAMPAFIPILLPLLVCLIPLADMVLAIVRRLITGKSPFEADRKHIHHRILDLGHTHRGTVLLLYVWATLFSFGQFLYVWMSGITATLILVGLVFVALIITFAPKIFITPIFEE